MEDQTSKREKAIMEQIKKSTLVGGCVEQIDEIHHQEKVWLKPATWIAGFALLFSILTSVFYFGRGVGETASKAKDITHRIEQKVNREEFIKLQGSVELIRQNVDNMKETQNASFKDMNKRLEKLFELVQDSKNGTPKKK